MAAAGGYFGGDQWLDDYESCERLRRTILEKIDERDRQGNTGRNFTQDNVTIRPFVKKLDGGLNKLKNDLLRLISSSRITAMEGDRRQSMLDSLVGKFSQLEVVFEAKRSSARGAERSSLLGNDFSQAAPSMSWNDPDEGNTVPEDFSVEDFQTKQAQIIKQQDQGLESLSAVIARQKQLAYAIGDEADLHNELIDDITDHVDRTHDRLIRETRHVNIVSKKSGTCGLWVVIILLMVAIIVIVAVPFK